MPRVATKLAPAHKGGFIARKVIPADAREEYRRLYGRRVEERLNTGPIPILLARAKHREWASEIEARIAAIRAERKGDGRTLTPKEARALAGEWYRWFVAHMEGNKWSKEVLTAYRDRMWEGLYSIEEGFGDDPFENADMRHVRPVISDEGKTAQFLAGKGLQLDSPSRDMFLDFAAQDFFAALDLLVRRADGDFGKDEYAARFPTSLEGVADPALTPWALFERWITEARPAPSTVRRWRGVFLKLQSDFPNASAAALLPAQMHEWAKGLISRERSARTVAQISVRAARTVFNWAVAQKLIARNPFAGWSIKVPKTIRMRETKALTDEEIKTILAAALAINGRRKGDAAKRWCPWLAAYSGARMGEITQLRGIDIVERDGVHAMKLSPEAGTIKTGTARTVPIHEHLIEQGFLKFMKANGKGPLFYNEPKSPPASDDPTNPRKPRYVKARERIATWVRGLGVNDPELSPNHTWRHTFKAIGFRNGMTEKIIDFIVGHAPASVGRGYGEPTLADKAQELRKFPRYKCKG